MGSLAEQPHFVLFPFMAQGHLIPMVDIGILLARRGVIITIVTTPHNAARIEKIVARASESGHSIRLVQLQIPLKEAGLPEGSENLDMLSALDHLKFFQAVNTMLREPAQKLIEGLTPRPSCIISDMCLFYTCEIASKLQIPRISFHGFCCFCLLCWKTVRTHKVLEGISSDFEYFTLPNLPDKLEFTRNQLLSSSETTEEWKEILDRMAEVDRASYGVVVNTFEELESAYVKQYRESRGGKVWCMGPVSLSHNDDEEKAQRGNKASVDEYQCLKWLDSQETGSVIYVCLGSLCNLASAQLKELGLGLEASNRPFIWVIRPSDKTKEVEQWILEDGFEERNKGRGLVILGWAPQVLILSHPEIGGFLTHCGWNSTLEGVCAGLPLITWPLFGDQFCNEKLVVQIAKIGVRIGVEFPLKWGEEEKAGVLVKKEDVINAVESLMDGGKEGEERRKRAKELGEMAKKAVEVGGSSYLNITMFIRDIMHATISEQGPNHA